MRFLVDENLSFAIAAALRERGHDVLFVPDSALRGASDQELWVLAAHEDRILVTLDLDFPLTLKPSPPALIILRFRRAVSLQTMVAIFSREVGNLEGRLRAK